MADQTEQELREELMKLRTFLKHYSNETSIHGVKNAFDDSKSRTFRISWMILGVVAIAFLLKTLFDLYIAVHQYQVQTVIKIVPTEVLTFPAVTICNLNGLEVGKFRNHDFTTTFPYNLSDLMLNITMETFLLKQLISSYPRQFLDKPFQPVSKLAFAELEDTLTGCTWDGDEKPCENMFVPLDLEMRRCFQFNSMGTASRMRSGQSGLDSGLQVTFDVRQDDYLMDNKLAAGAQVILHEPGEMPDIINKGFFVEPGTAVFCKMRKQRFTYLPEPFKAYGTEACVEHKEMSPSHKEKSNFTVYSSALCQRMCADRLTQATCRCRLSDSSTIFTDDLPLCTIKDVYTCYIRSFDINSRKVKKSTCNCPRLCSFKDYEVTLSQSRFPSDVTVNRMKLLNPLTTMSDQEKIRKNFINLKIFFDDMVYKDVEHVPALTLETIIGTIGGHLGLFLGASVLSLMELTYLLIAVLQRGGNAAIMKITRRKQVKVYDKTGSDNDVKNVVIPETILEQTRHAEEKSVDTLEESTEEHKQARQQSGDSLLTVSASDYTLEQTLSQESIKRSSYVQ